jgi:hypothetical protein
MNIDEICEIARNESPLTGLDAKALVDELDEMEALAERWEDRCCHQTIRADDLNRTVATMGEVLHECVEAFADIGIDATLPVLHARAILSRPDVTAERGRWVSRDEVIGALTKAGLSLGVHSAMDLNTHIKRVREDFDAIASERDAAIARAEKAEAEAALWIDRYDDLDQRWEVMRKRARDAERSRDEIGIQLQAQSERLRLASRLLDVAMAYIVDGPVYDAIKAQWDAVPGDALRARKAGEE